MHPVGNVVKIDSASAQSLAEWWGLAGVDTLVDETPRDWRVPLPAPAASEPAPAASDRAHAAPSPPPARSLVFPDTLEAFRAWRLGPDAPEAGWPGTRHGAQGPAEADLMVVIDMPDRDGLLSGPAAALFDRMMAAIGLDRTRICLAPMAVARAVGTRLPADAEPVLARLLRAEVALARPRRLLVMGNAASRALLGMDAAAARGTLHRVNHDGAQTGIATVTSHAPRVLIDRPAAKADAWRDLLMLKGESR